MNEQDWKAAQNEAAKQELIRRSAEERRMEAEWCAAWFSQAERIRLKDPFVMMDEHETKIEMMGREYQALVRYECDPGDGWPVIHSVEIRTTKPGWDYEQDITAVETLTFDATEWLDKEQEEALENEIDAALRADAAANLADRLAMEREERGLFRRAA